jgi:hypothetical protein
MTRGKFTNKQHPPARQSGGPKPAAPSRTASEAVPQALQTGAGVSNGEPAPPAGTAPSAGPTVTLNSGDGQGSPPTGIPPVSMTPGLLDWHPLIQVIHGVLLSASVGAFAASGPPQILTGSEARLIWIVIAAASLIVSFDAWYQFVLNGRLLNINGSYSAYLIIGLIAAMVWTSFLPFQFLARNLKAADWKFLDHSPGNKLFGLSLCVTLGIEVLFTWLAALRTPSPNRPGLSTIISSASSEHFSLEKKSSVVFVLRLACVGTTIWLLLYQFSTKSDKVSETLYLLFVFGLFRIIETLIAGRFDRLNYRKLGV